MFEKKIASKFIQPLTPRDQFPVGTRWLVKSGPLQTEWKVVECSVTDATPMRRCQSSFGQEEVMTLETLRKDMKDYGFRFLEGLNETNDATGA